MSSLANRGSDSARRAPGRITLGGSLVVMGAVVAVLWGLELVDQVTGNSLDPYGIHPRTGDGLWQILVAPFLHYGWAHLISNTVPFFVLGALILVSGVEQWLIATAASVICSGLLVWLTSPSDSVTAGASGVVFGWLAFLLVRGFFTRKVGQILLAVLVLFVYGGILFGVLPGQDGISWQGHLGGALGGMFAAWLAGTRRP